jgi:asparagine synthase (glutamine-hydrolysing)
LAVRLVALVNWAEQVDPSDVGRLRGDVGFAVSSPSGVAVAAEIVSTGANPPIRVDHVMAVADARIDNADELKKELGLGGLLPEAVILAHAYMRWGPTFTERITGDFSVILWDEQKDLLLAARDPLGVRSLCYRTSGFRTWFATDVEQLLPTFDSRPEPDDQMIVEHLLYRSHSKGNSFFREILRLPPGHLALVRRHHIRLDRYWRPPSGQMGFDDPREWQSEFRRLFVRAVERRLRSTSPVLVHLSGGLDSSSIIGAANEIAGRGLPCPSVLGASAEYPGLSCDEGPFVQAVAEHIRFPVERWNGLQIDVSDLDDPSPVGPNLRSVLTGGSRGDVEIARRIGARVILTGFGGDQLCVPMGGTLDLIASWRFLTAARDLLVFSGANRKTRWARLRSLVRSVAPLWLHRAWAPLKANPPSWLATSMWPRARRATEPLPMPGRFESFVQRAHWDLLGDEQSVRIIEAGQRIAYGFGVEMRFPFLDLDLVRFVLSLPGAAWPAEVPFARLHRAPLGDLLPPMVTARRSKAEFTPALVNLVTVAAPRIDAMFQGREWLSARYVSQSRARILWSRVRTQPDHNASTTLWRQVWHIATLEAWLRQIFGYTTVRREALHVGSQ